jgi:hypothetical protein
MPSEEFQFADSHLLRLDLCRSLKQSLMVRSTDFIVGIFQLLLTRTPHLDLSRRLSSRRICEPTWRMTVFDVAAPVFPRSFVEFRVKCESPPLHSQMLRAKENGEIDKT